MEFTPQRVDVLLLIIHAGEFHQMVSDGRVSPICPNHEIKIYLNLPRAPVGRRDYVTHFKPRFASAEVGTCQFVVEEQLDVRQRVQYIKKALIQARPVNSEYSLVIRLSK